MNHRVFTYVALVIHYQYPAEPDLISWCDGFLQWAETGQECVPAACHTVWTQGDLMGDSSDPVQKESVKSGCHGDGNSAFFYTFLQSTINKLSAGGNGYRAA